MSYFTNSNLKRIALSSNVNLSKYFEDGQYGFYDKKHEYVVICYNYKLTASIRNDSRVFVEVVMVNLTEPTYHKDGIEKQNQLIITAPINLLHKIPFGSIWKNGKCRERFEMEEFTIKFSADTLQHKPLNLSEKHPFEYQYYIGKFEQKYFGQDKNNLLIVNQDKSYIIHPLHFFMAHYGYSSEIKRMLSIYSYNELKEKLFIDNSINAVVLPYNLTQRDAVFLWHLKYDEYTKIAVKSLSSQLYSARQDGKYYTIKPWHSQEIELSFRGICLGNSVLCCQITGISEPQGETIQVALANVEKSEQSAGVTKIMLISRKHKMEELDLALNPVNSLVTEEIKEKLGLLGEARTIIKTLFDKQIGDMDIQQIPFDTPSDYSVGEVYGHGNTGLANCFYDTEENKSRLDIVWEHATRLRDDGYTVEWFTPNLGFNESDDFKLVSLKKIAKALHKSHPVSALLIRLRKHGRVFMVINFGENESGSSMSGIVYEIGHCKDWSDILIELVQVGIDSDYIDSYKGKMAKFIHRCGKNNNWVLNGLKKLV